MNTHRKALSWGAILASMLLLFSCSPSVSPSPSAPVSPTQGSGVGTSPVPLATAAPENPCGIAPIVVPTPAVDPGYVQKDTSTGLHMTGTVQLIELAAYRLRVTGKVERPLELTYDQIRCLPKVEASPDLVCPGFFVDKALWAGAPIADVLALAQVQEGAKSVRFVSADGYSNSLSLDKASDRANFLAYEWEGEPLPRLHGFPLRVVIPEADGGQWTKWVVELRVE